MTILTKATCATIVSGAMRAAFEDRFQSLLARAKAELVSDVNTKHPEWVAARADKGHPLRKYLLSTHRRPEVEVGGRTNYMRVPSFNGAFPNYAGYARDKERVLYEMPDNSAEAPYHQSYGYVVTVGLRDEYVRLWDAYNEAWTLLASTLASYRTVEAMVKEFPEYAEYVPAYSPKTATGLPAVIPEQVRFKLTTLGVPAQGDTK